MVVCRQAMNCETVWNSVTLASVALLIFYYLDTLKQIDIDFASQNKVIISC